MEQVAKRPVIVVGAGLAGLCCAQHLSRAQAPVRVLEAGSRIGGRVASEVVDGFRLDVGFQVLLTAYPEARAQLDYAALGLRAFRAGSLIRLSTATTRIVDPWREPLRGAASLFTSPLLSIADAVRMLRLRRRLLHDGPAPPGTASDVLDELRLSPPLRHSFLGPFFSGVTLDPELAIPADYFAFLFRMFAMGTAALPARGMGAIPAQLAGTLPAGTIRLGHQVREIGNDFVVLDDGVRMAASAVVVATDGSAAAELVESVAPPRWLGTTTLYFAADRAPIDEPMLMLNGTGDGPIHHVCVPSIVQPAYAVNGQALVSVSVLGGEGAAGKGPALADAVRTQLSDWFDGAPRHWRWLRSYHIPHALPRLPARQLAMSRPGIARVGENVIVCGDHLATPSIQGAMLAGRHAAEAVLAGRATTRASLP